MNHRVLIALVALASTASALDARRTKTEAAIVRNATGAQAMQLSFTAELAAVDLPSLMRNRVVVGWQEVGGIQPQPFRVVIPAGCLTGTRGLRVEDFRRCGVQIVSGRLGVAFITDFEARFVPRDDGITRFHVEATFIPPDPGHGILGALGGAAVDISLGAESARSLPVSAATVSGVSPDPF